LADLPADVVAQRATAAPGDAEKGKLLFKHQSCINCRTFANGQQPKGPHLADIGKSRAARGPDRVYEVAALATLTFQNMLHLSQVLMVESTKPPSPADEL